MVGGGEGKSTWQTIWVQRRRHLGEATLGQHLKRKRRKVSRVRNSPQVCATMTVSDHLFLLVAYRSVYSDALDTTIRFYMVMMTSNTFRLFVERVLLDVIFILQEDDF